MDVSQPWTKKGHGIKVAGSTATNPTSGVAWVAATPTISPDRGATWILQVGEAPEGYAYYVGAIADAAWANVNGHIDQKGVWLFGSKGHSHLADGEEVTLSGERPFYEPGETLTLSINRPARTLSATNARGHTETLRNLPSVPLCAAARLYGKNSVTMRQWPPTAPVSSARSTLARLPECASLAYALTHAPY